MASGYSIDSYLIKKFQGVSDKLQLSVGYDNFAIAKFLRVTMIAAFAIREIISVIQGINAAEILVIACSLTVIFKMEVMMSNAQKSIKNRYEIMNTAVVDYATTRIIIQFISMAAFGFLLMHIHTLTTPAVTKSQQLNEWKEVCWDIFGILLFFVAYFNSCTPKPYKPGKAKSLIQDSKTLQNSLAVVPKN